MIARLFITFVLAVSTVLFALAHGMQGQAQGGDQFLDGIGETGRDTSDRSLAALTDGLGQSDQIVLVRVGGQRTGVADLLTALGRPEETLRLRVFTEIRDISQRNRAPLYVGLTLLVLILAALGYWFLR